MTQDQLKQAVAQAALRYVVEGEVIGVGTGSTANYFIDALAPIKHTIKGAVASSEATAMRLRDHGIAVVDLNNVTSMPVYIDGADEITATGAMIKGGGAALTREKIVTSIAERFICIADWSKLVDQLGVFPLPLEVIPIAHKAVARALTKLGATPRLRLKDEKPLVTDNGGFIIDAFGMQINDPITLEQTLNNIVGVVTNGLFAAKGASLCLLGTPEGVRTLNF